MASCIIANAPLLISPQVTEPQSPQKSPANPNTLPPALQFLLGNTPPSSINPQPTTQLPTITHRKSHPPSLYPAFLTVAGSADALPRTSRLPLIRPKVSPPSSAPPPTTRPPTTLNPAAPSPQFKRGELIDCQYRRKSRWYSGRIGFVNGCDSYDVYYDDGERESGVVGELIRRREGGEKRAARKRAPSRVKRGTRAASAVELDVVLECGLTQRQLQALQSRDIRPEDYELLLTLDESVAKPKSKLCTARQVDEIAMVDWAGDVHSDTSGVVVVEECGVCMEAFEGGEKLRQMGCCRKHLHDECIRRWLTTQKNTCPNCMHVHERREVK